MGADAESEVKKEAVTTRVTAWARRSAGADLATDLVILGEALCLFFGEDEPVVERHFKHAAAGGEQLNALEEVLELLQQFMSQAHGPVNVASGGAVLDGDPHRFLQFRA